MKDFPMEEVSILIQNYKKIYFKLQDDSAQGLALLELEEIK